VGHQPAEIRADDDLPVYEKPFAGLASKTPQLPGVFGAAEQARPSVSGFGRNLAGYHWRGCDERMEYIVDSCPIILAKGPRSGHAKVANELCEKSYNSSRKEWYYGVKLHTVVARKPGRLPVPLALMASSAAQHDLPAAKQILDDHISLTQGRLYADKAYSDATWTDLLKNGYALELITSRKKHKGDTLVSGDTFSTFVSSVRQPIECFFNWLNRLTNIQSASLVRSFSGLLLHIFGRLTAALITLIFNP